MNITCVKALFHKEIQDIFRDKKTIFMMIVIPLLLYPLMIVGMTMLFSSIASNQVETVYKVAFVDVPNQEEILSLLEDEDQNFTYSMELVDTKDAPKALESGEIDAYLSYKQGKEYGYVFDKNGVISLSGKLIITYCEADNDSSTAQKALEDLIYAYQEKLRGDNLKTLNMDEDLILYPVKFSSVGISSTEETLGNVIGQTIPMMIIVCIMMGAIYPAIDVTAGEKERGTLETLLTLPVTNLELLAAKFLAVALIACVTAILNVVSMGVASGFMVTMLAESAEGMNLSIHLSSFIPAVVLTMVVMCAFALLVTVCCMYVCLFAKNFKEANNYITPVMLVFMFCGFASMIPNLELTQKTAAIPIINVSLLIENLFHFKNDYSLFGIVFFSNLIYSAVLLVFLARFYNSEAILFSEGLSSVKIITKRSEMKKGQLPGVGDVVFLIGITMFLLLYVVTVIQLKVGFWGVLASPITFLSVPLIYAWYMKADMKKLFSIKCPGILQLLSSFVIWIGGYLLIIVVSVGLSFVFQESASNVEETFGEFLKQPLIALIFVIAIMPAIAEEITFRGFLYGSIRDKTKMLTAMLIVSAIFGIYHMSLIKFFSTGLLGLMLVYVVEKTGSIFCSMFIHFCNNLMSVLIMKYTEELKNIVPILFKEDFSGLEIVGMIVIGIIILGSGLFLLDFSTKKLAKIKKLW